MIMVVPKQSATTPVTRELGEDLVAMSDTFAQGDRDRGRGRRERRRVRRLHERGQREDLAGRHRRGRSSILLLLIVMLRAVVLPVVAVAFDLLTAAATFGILSRLYSGDDPLLDGGPGYIDPISIIGIFAFIFGVSMVYEVVLLHRTREAFLATGDAHGALRTGLREDGRCGDRRRGGDARGDHPVRHGRPA